MTGAEFDNMLATVVAEAARLRCRGVGRGGRISCKGRPPFTPQGVPNVCPWCLARRLTEGAKARAAEKAQQSARGY